MINKLTKYNLYDTIVYVVFNYLPKKLKNKYYILKYWIKAYLLNIEIGRENNILGDVFFSKFPNSTIVIGDRFNSVNDYFISSFNYVNKTRIKTFSSSSKIIIGNNVDINSSSLLCNSTKIIIGNNVLIAPNCIITDSNFHGVTPDKRDERDPKSDNEIIIEDNVWIGMNCILTKGVTIGKNSVIGAGSVVLKNVEPNCLYAGNPAKFIKKIA